MYEPSEPLAGCGFVGVGESKSMQPLPMARGSRLDRCCPDARPVESLPLQIGSVHGASGAAGETGHGTPSNQPPAGRGQQPAPGSPRPPSQDLQQAPATLESPGWFWRGQGALPWQAL